MFTSSCMNAKVKGSYRPIDAVFEGFYIVGGINVPLAEIDAVRLENERILLTIVEKDYFEAEADTPFGMMDIIGGKEVELWDIFGQRLKIELTPEERKNILS